MPGTTPQSAIDIWGRERLPQCRVRWEEFRHRWTDWEVCQLAEIRGGALAVIYTDGGRDLIPLHVIRGRIQVRRIDEAD